MKSEKSLAQTSSPSGLKQWDWFRVPKDAVVPDETRWFRDFVRQIAPVSTAVLHALAVIVSARYFSSWSAAGLTAQSPAVYLLGASAVGCVLPMLIWSRPLHWLIAAVAALVAGIIGGAYPVLLWLAPVLSVAALGYSFAPNVRGKDWASSVRSTALLALLLTAICAYRWPVLIQTITLPPQPDADAFLKIAQQAFFYETKAREPLFVWLIQLSLFIGGTSAGIALNVLSSLTSVVAMVTIFEYLRRYAGLLAAVVAVALYGYSPFLTQTAANGLREDLIIALFFGVCWVLHHMILHGWRVRRVVGLGILGALFSLLRLNSLSFCLMAGGIGMALTAWRYRVALKQAALGYVMLILLIVVPVIPHLAYIKREYGDPFFIVNFLAVRFYANVEFAGKHPDFPTVEEFQKDGYAGGPITMRDYLFKYHTVPQVIKQSLVGLRRMLIGDLATKVWVTPFQLPPPEGAYAQYAAIAGWLTPPGWLLAVMLLMFHGPGLFLMGLWDFDPRLATVVMAVSMCGIGMLAGFVFRRIGMFAREFSKIRGDSVPTRTPHTGRASSASRKKSGRRD